MIKDSRAKRDIDQLSDLALSLTTSPNRTRVNNIELSEKERQNNEVDSFGYKTFCCLVLFPVAVLPRRAKLGLLGGSITLILPLGIGPILMETLEGKSDLAAARLFGDNNGNDIAPPPPPLAPVLLSLPAK